MDNWPRHFGYLPRINDLRMPTTFSTLKGIQTNAHAPFDYVKRYIWGQQDFTLGLTYAKSRVSAQHDDNI